MKIVIDVSQIVYGTGVSVYTKNLIESLLRIDEENEYLLFAGALRRQDEIRSYFKELGKYSFREKVVPLPPMAASLLWNKLHMIKIENFTGKMDVFHSSDWVQPPSSAFRVTTVHDLVPLKYPKLSHSRITSTHILRLKWVLKEVERIIVPSRSSADDLVKLGVGTGRIRVIPEAPDPKIKPSTRKEVEDIKRRYRISGKYLLSIGITPRKNTDRILEAYGKVKGETNLKLVIIGHPYVNFHPPRGVLVLGHVPSEELATFYSGAEALVYPSLYEGFGLPILESMTCRTPVVTSDVGSMAEVGGNAAVLVDPYKVNLIADGILEAIKNKEKYIKLGRKRVKEFSWEKTARETLRVYNESNTV